jgi:hypothetical protein
VEAGARGQIDDELGALAPLPPLAAVITPPWSSTRWRTIASPRPRPVWVRVESTGLTGASHDAADAKSTCTTLYRFSSALSAGGWRLYVQQGRPKISGSVAGGPPMTLRCHQFLER